MARAMPFDLVYLRKYHAERPRKSTNRCSDVQRPVNASTDAFNQAGTSVGARIAVAMLDEITPIDNDISFNPITLSINARSLA